MQNINKFVLRLLTSTTLVAVLSSAASANVLLYSDTHDYGINGIDPYGTDTLFSDHVEVFTNDLNTRQRFRDNFSFPNINGNISSIEITLMFDNAGPVCNPFCQELWFFRDAQPDPNGQADVTKVLRDSGSLSPQTFVYSALTDTGVINEFSLAVANRRFDFHFSELSAGDDYFDLYWAKIDIYGTPAVTAVPLPPALLLFVGSLSGLLLVGRKRSVGGPVS